MTRLAGALLFGLVITLPSILLIVAPSHLDEGFPLFIAAVVFLFEIAAVVFFLLLRSFGRSSPRFPSTTLERGLEQLFALLIPRPKATTFAMVLAAMQRYVIVTGLRRNARRWITELQSLSTDGYERASSISSRFPGAGDHDSRALIEEAVRVLRAERAGAGVDLTLASDPVTVLAYGLGARPADTDLRSLDELLDDLGFAGGGEELRTHFDEVIAAETDCISPRLEAPAERHTFRDLAGASFVLGASARIVELASPPPAALTG